MARLTKGFTLIEVLIGMVILSLMMMLLFSSLHGSISSWELGEKKIIEVNKIASVQHFFKNYLEPVLPLTLVEEKNKFAFQGDAKHLQFAATAPSSAKTLGILLFSLSLEPQHKNPGKSMMISLKPFFPEKNAQGWKTDKLALLKNIKNASFSYFGKKNATQSPEWSQSWEKQNKLPLLVRIKIELVNGNVLPEIIVAPKTAI